jgi:uncharacterized protein (DUF952 family)
VEAKHIYRLVSRSDWDAARRAGEFTGTAHDLRDGFIHFSAEHQVSETARKHYADQADLLLLRVDTSRLAELTSAELKWEISRGGERFPHLYGSLPVAAVERAEPYEVP